MRKKVKDCCLECECGKLKEYWIFVFVLSGSEFKKIG